MNTRYTLGRGYFSTHHTIARLIGKNKTVLDVGCNKGYLGKIADPSNAFYGVDYSASDVDRAKKVYTKVCRSDLNEMKKLPWNMGRFDVLVFADLLEHLIYPERVLAFYVENYLKKNGRVIISLPNIANWTVRGKLLSGSFDYTETGILDKTHLHFYTYKTARMLMESAGLEIVQEEAGSTVLGPVIFYLHQLRGLLASSIILEGIIHI